MGIVSVDVGHGSGFGQARILRSRGALYRNMPPGSRLGAAVARLKERGHRPVMFNPYWDRRGRTFADPDGYRVVLQNSPWPV
jgi:hypothetical protein